MDFLRDEMTEEDDPKQVLINTLTARLSIIKRKRDAMKTQIEQTNMMVDREQTRNADIASELQTIQATLGQIPREDIRDKYNDALDIRSRLATMRGQLEKFENQYEMLGEEQSLLTQVLNQFEDVDFGDDGDDDVGESKGTANIVRIVQAQEDERKRLADQLHDGPAQSLTNFILQAEICQRLFNRDPERAAEELNSLKESASGTFQKVRDFIFDLSPMMLYDLGVVPTVRRYADSFREKSDIEVEVEIGGEERRLDQYLEVMTFRSIQELMIHGRDYAAATHLKVQLTMGAQAIKITVRDNGRGFDAEALFSGNVVKPGQLDSRSEALAAMRERYDMIGGQMSVTSSDEGSVVRLELPVQK